MGKVLAFPTRKTQVHTQESPMDMARGWLDNRKVLYDIVTDHHLRVGSVNFYPKKMRVYVDGLDSGYERKGFDALEQALKRYGYL